MTKIYVVTQGAYSDYSIIGVFSSRKKAERVAELESNDSYDDAEVEEYELNKEELFKVKIKVTMKKNGDVIDSIPVNSAPGFRGFRNKDEEIIWIARTDDVQRAVKKTNEMRTLVLTHGLWGDWHGTWELFHSSKQEVM